MLGVAKQMYIFFYAPVVYTIKRRADGSKATENTEVKNNVPRHVPVMGVCVQSSLHTYAEQTIIRLKNAFTTRIVGQRDKCRNWQKKAECCNMAKFGITRKKVFTHEIYIYQTIVNFSRKGADVMSPWVVFFKGRTMV